MKPIQNYDKISEAGDIERLPAGIYGVRITNVIDHPEDEYLEITCDIVKGEYKDYFKLLVDNGMKDTSKTIRSYKTNALPFFKAFITAIEKSNQNFQWDWDEKKLIGKNVIAVFGEEEYEAKDGSIKVSTKLVDFRSLEAFKEGKITVPPLKKLERKPVVQESSSANLDILDTPDDDLPF